MREGIRIIMLFFVGGIISGCSPLIHDPTSDLLYYRMLEDKARKANANVDFAKLRIAFTRTGYYDPYDGSLNALNAEMISAINSNKFTDALKIAHQILETNFVNIYAHHACAIAYDQLGNIEKKDFHSKIAGGLLKSILQSGDGKTKESAFIVISADEEYALVDMLGLQIKSQSLIDGDEHKYDLLEVYDPKSQKILSLYFNIDIPHKWVAKQFR